MAGNIKVQKPRNNYEPISKDIIFDKEIDVLTLGLFVKVIALSDKWELNIKGLSTTFGISTDKVRSCIAKLEEAGYLTREQGHDEKGRMNGWDYTFINAPAVHRHSQNTDVGKNRMTENTDVGKTPMSVNSEGLYNNNISISNNSISVKLNPHNNSKGAKFDFYTSLLGLGVSEQTAMDWMAVRKAKRAVNTLTAYNQVKAEIEASGKAAEECIKAAVLRNWCGFKASWLNDQQSSSPKHEEQEPAPSTMEYIREIRARREKEDREQFGY